jgi:multicomponent Na+:H+ antiporter subunit D
MILDGSFQEGLEFVWLMLLIGSAGVFLHAGIKFPWFVFFHKDKKIVTTDPPIFMKSSMVVSSLICILIGIMPSLLYNLLPYEVSFIPYTGNHIISQLHLLLFSGLAFFISLKYLERTLTITLDFDWVYRNKNRLVSCFLNIFINRAEKIKILIQSINIKEKTILLENFLLKQISISVMVTMILIIFAIFLVLNIS